MFIIFYNTYTHQVKFGVGSSVLKRMPGTWYVIDGLRTMVLYFQNMEKCTSAVRSTKKNFDQNSALPANTPLL